MASIKQYRGKTWRAIVRRTGFPSESKTFALKKDAEAWAAGVEAKMGISRHDPLQLRQAKVTTVKDVFDRYVREVVQEKRGRNAKSILERIIRDADFMMLRLDLVTPEHISLWRDDRLAGNPAKKRPPISRASVNREMNSISGVFTHAIKEWRMGLPANPCHSVSWFKDADKPRDKVWRADDVTKFLTAAGWREDLKPTCGRDYVGWAALLAIETAMREGEICLPTVADFHEEGRYLHLKNTKNGDSRNVPLSKKAIAILRILCEGKKPEDRIVPLVANTLGEYTLDVRRKCGLEHLRFHDLRHTAATAISKKLPNVLELSAQTGHRSLRALKRYYHPEPADIASKLD